MALVHRRLVTVRTFPQELGLSSLCLESTHLLQHHPYIKFKLDQVHHTFHHHEQLSHSIRKQAEAKIETISNRGSLSNRGSDEEHGRGMLRN